MLLRNFIALAYLSIWNYEGVEGAACMADAVVDDPPASGIYCVTRNKFAFVEDVDATNKALNPGIVALDCPEGAVCVDSEAVCEVDGVPACEATRGVCGSCEGANIACLSTTTYTFCANGVPSLKPYTCPAKTYCSVKDKGVRAQPCTLTKVAESDCPPPATTVATTVSTTVSTTAATTTATDASQTTTQNGATTVASNGCNGLVGTYAVTTDKTCKQYYYCYFDSNLIKRAEYTCSGTSVFHPLKGKCVLASTYICPN